MMTDSKRVAGQSIRRRWETLSQLGGTPGSGGPLGFLAEGRFAIPGCDAQPEESGRDDSLGRVVLQLAPGLHLGERGFAAIADTR